MIHVKWLITQFKVIFFAFFFIAITLTLRLSKANFDFSYFIVAGSEFVDEKLTPSPIIVQQGQGYDGQFFYKYAIHPLNFDKNKFGVNVDLPNYRMQRIAYPALAWLFALSNPNWIPFSLVLVNFLAFMGIIFYSTKITKFYRTNMAFSLFPLFFCGLYMSLSRDLSEVVELFFFSASLYYFITNKTFYFCLFSTFTLFTRETSIIAIFVLIFCDMFYIFKHRLPLFKIIYFLLPVLLLVIWKFTIQKNVISSGIGDGYGQIGVPFKGIIDGFIHNLNFSDFKHSMEFLFWIAYFFWSCFFIFLTLKLIMKNFQLSELINQPLILIYLIWLVFAVLFNITIYIDDWGFMRIFSLWNFVGFVFIVQNNYKVPRIFVLFSVLLVLLTVFRVTIRV